MVNGTYRCSIMGRSAADLWMDALSMTMTEFGQGYGFMLSRRPSMKLLKLAALYEPARTSKCKTPSKDKAGRTEYLKNIRSGVRRTPNERTLSHECRCRASAQALPPVPNPNLAWRYCGYKQPRRRRRAAPHGRLSPCKFHSWCALLRRVERPPETPDEIYEERRLLRLATYPLPLISTTSQSNPNRRETCIDAAELLQLCLYLVQIDVRGSCDQTNHELKVLGIARID